MLLHWFAASIVLCVLAVGQCEHILMSSAKETVDIVGEETHHRREMFFHDATTKQSSLITYHAVRDQLSPEVLDLSPFPEIQLKCRSNTSILVIYGQQQQQQQQPTTGQTLKPAGRIIHDHTIMRPGTGTAVESDNAATVLARIRAGVVITARFAPGSQSSHFCQGLFHSETQQAPVETVFLAVLHAQAVASADSDDTSALPLRGSRQFHLQVEQISISHCFARLNVEVTGRMVAEQLAVPTKPEVM